MRDELGLSEQDLAKLGHCAICKKPLLGGALPIFYRIEISRFGFDGGAVQRRAGLEMMLGNAALASVFSPDRHLATCLDGPATVAVHETCADKVHHLLMLMPEEQS